jgi:malonate decarboxylase epsilon subunit
MTTAFLFPGQGSQHEGMLHSLPVNPAVAATFDEVSAALGFDVKQLDTDKALKSTVSVQMSIFASGIAVGRALLALDLHPKAVAGLSVGAFAAAVISGALTVTDGVKLVKQRGQLMEQLFNKGYGMSAIVGLDQRQVGELVGAVCSEKIPVYVANINASRQIVIAGSDEGMALVRDSALARGARKAERLNVSVPSHCKLLEPVANALRSSLAGMTLRQPNTIYISNVTARPLRTAAEIGFDLANNIANSVHWYQANVLLKELGCTLFLEMNPGRVLTDLASENVPDVRAKALEFSSLGYAVNLALKAKSQSC